MENKMLKGLKKEFNKLINKETEMTVAQVAEVSEQTLSVQELTEKLATSETAYAELNSQFASLTKELASAKEMLSKLEEVKAQMEADALEKRMTARKEAIEASFGTQGANELFEATKDLSDEHFNTVVAAKKASYAAEAESPLFKEVGATGTTDVAKVEESNGVEAILKQKYRATKTK